MIPFKARVNKSVSKGFVQNPIKIGTKYNDGYAVRLQSVFYSSMNPHDQLHLFDGDGDKFTFTIPGQLEAGVVHFDSPLTVKLPISYVDTAGDMEIILWGEVEKIG